MMSRNRKMVLLGGLLVLVLAVNGTFAFAYDRLSGGSQLLVPTDVASEGVIASTQDAAGDVVLVTRANVVQMYDASSQLARSVDVGETIGAIAGLADGGVVVGTGKGQVIPYAADGTAGTTATVSGRVTAIAASPAGDGVFAAHGVGAFGVRFYLSFIPTGATEPSVTWQIGQPVTALIPWQDGVLYGTGSSQVGYFDLATPDAAAWSVVLTSPISRLHPDASGILIGDEKGNVTAIDEAGTTRWLTSVGQYAVRGVAWDAADGKVLVGDANGGLAILDGSGGVVYQGAAGGADLETIVHSGDRWLAIPREGTWQVLDPGAGASTTSAGTVRLWWMIANAALAIYGAVTAILLVDGWTVRSRRLAGQTWRGKMGYLFVLPAVGLIGLFSYYPTAMSIYYSFTSYSLRTVTEWIGLDNYRTILFDDLYFKTGIRNMAILTLSSVIKTITIPLLIAELIFWLRNSFHAYIFRTLFILPTVVPGLVFTLMWRQIYDPDTGLINEALGAIGLGSWQRAWLGNPETALWAIVGVGFPWVDAFALLIFLGGLLNINGDYFDAAKVDGATWWQRFRHVDLQLLVPQIRILLFFAIAGTIQGFVAIFILTRGGPGMTTYIPALQMYNRISDGDFGYASAVGVILFLIVMMLTFIVLRFRRNDAVDG